MTPGIILWFSKQTRWTSHKLKKLIWKIKLDGFKNEIIFVKFVEIVSHLNRSFLTILMRVRAKESGKILVQSGLHEPIGRSLYIIAEFQVRFVPGPQTMEK